MSSECATRNNGVGDEDEDIAADLSSSKGSSGLHQHAERSAGHYYPSQKENSKRGVETVVSGVFDVCMIFLNWGRGEGCVCYSGQVDVDGGH